MIFIEADHDDRNSKIQTTDNKRIASQPPSDSVCKIVDDSDDYDSQEEDEDHYSDSSEDDSDIDKSELACPFCLEGFDILGLCCHIYHEHGSQAKSGICPVCTKKVGFTMAAHLMDQHAMMLKTIYRRKVRYGCFAALSLWKELSDQGSHVFSKGSATPDPSSNKDMSDLLLLSFICFPQPAYSTAIIEASSSSTANTVDKIADGSSCERKREEPLLADEDREQKTERWKFLQGLLASLILDD